MLIWELFSQESDSETYCVIYSELYTNPLILTQFKSKRKVVEEVNFNILLCKRNIQTYIWQLIYVAILKGKENCM